MIIIKLEKIDQKIKNILKNWFIKIDTNTYFTNVNLKKVKEIVESIDLKDNQKIYIYYENKILNIIKKITIKR